MKLSTVAPKFSNGAYDALKWVVMIFIPAVSLLYFGLSQIWGFPNGEQVVGSLALVATFLGSLLGLSNVQYKANDAGLEGIVHVVDSGEGEPPKISLELDATLEEMVSQNQIVFKVARDI